MVQKEENQKEVIFNGRQNFKRVKKLNKVLYGGSVTAQNASTFVSQSHIQGILVGTVQSYSHRF